MAKFQIVRSADRQYFWHLLADNGKKVAWSGEKYVNKRDCVNMLNQIRQNAATIRVEDTT